MSSWALGRRGYTRAKQMVWSWHPPRPLFVLQHLQRWSSFHADFQAFSKWFRQKWFSSCLPKGGLVHWPRIMGFHWGRVTRRRVFFLGGGAHNWQSDVLFSEGRRHKSTQHNRHSLLISHAHTHIVALILQMNKVVLSLPARLCYMCGALKTGCVCSGLMCSVWFGWHTVKWT